MSFFSTAPHNTITSTGTATKTADEATSKSGFAVPPAALHVDDSEKDEDEENTKEKSWSRGMKVHIMQRTKALDPYSHEYIFLTPHTKGEIVNLRDQSRVPRNHFAFKLETVDNGDGRIVLVEGNELVADGLFSHLK